MFCIFIISFFLLSVAVKEHIYFNDLGSAKKKKNELHCASGIILSDFFIQIKQSNKKNGQKSSEC